MKNLQGIKEKFLEKGMKESNIDYAFDAVKYGTEKYLIVQNLTSVYRQESQENSELLLAEILEPKKSATKRTVSNPRYSSQQQKLYNDHNQLSTNELLEMVSSGKYRNEVVEIVNDILVERKAIEVETGQNTGNIRVEEKRKRNLALTTYLVIMIIANILLILLDLVYLLNVNEANDENILYFITGILSIFNIIFINQLFQWKKSGFRNMIYLWLVIFAINVIREVSVYQSLLGLLGLFILFIFLQFEKDGKSAWEQLN